MSRYPSESVERFDQQFRETEGERNARLREKRERATYWSRVQRRLASGVTVECYQVKGAPAPFFVGWHGGEPIWSTRDPKRATALYLQHSEGRA